ncbi:DMT family transporter [Vibrio tapetis]|uniref:Putative Multidrug resistance efflux transporter EmrE n=1 Tax=Vibrio tapetis subsp. tapetis TaxID=1671868 RepID=A0A2N8ZFQ4_9VIBR|nr:DMT family transporter [Vibrio tapetis]SON50743.1 putative Multidrug resistance efflux transporter EmrE [Vibrio tapetis subsp. tapetis]
MTRSLSLFSQALLLLVAGNLFASLSDVSVKLLNGELSTYQYIFIRQLIGFLVVLPFWLRLSKVQQSVGSLPLNLFRAHLVIIGSGCMMIAVTHLPLATANAVFYAAPVLMLPLSIWLLKEIPAKSKVIATCIGFIGVLIVLRPSQFHWAALFAMGTAITLALFNILVRKLPVGQPVVTTLFWTSLLSLPVSGLLAFIHWQPMSFVQLGWVASSAILILTYNGCAVLAYRKVSADQIAMVEYSGLVFVTLFGVLWFEEVPDWITLVGIVLIVLPMLIRRNSKSAS